MTWVTFCYRPDMPDICPMSAMSRNNINGLALPDMMDGHYPMSADGQDIPLEGCPVSGMSGPSGVSGGTFRIYAAAGFCLLSQLSHRMQTVLAHALTLSHCAQFSSITAPSGRKIAVSLHVDPISKLNG